MKEIRLVSFLFRTRRSVYLFMSQNPSDQTDQKQEAALQQLRIWCAEGKAREIATRERRAQKIAEKEARHRTLPVFELSDKQSSNSSRLRFLNYEINTRQIRVRIES